MCVFARYVGQMRVRRLFPLAVLLTAPVLVACDGSGVDLSADSSPTPTVSESPQPSASVSESDDASPTEASSATESAVPVTSEPPTDLPLQPQPACEVVSAARMKQAYEVTFSAGKSAQAGLGCTFVAKDLVTATVVVTDDSACVAPPERGNIIQPVDDIAKATKGWWVVSDAPPLKALLRACANGVTVDINLAYEDGVDYDGDPQTQSGGLAGEILGQLKPVS